MADKIKKIEEEIEKREVAFIEAQIKHEQEQLKEKQKIDNLKEELEKEKNKESSGGMAKHSIIYSDSGGVLFQSRPPIYLPPLQSTSQIMSPIQLMMEAPVMPSILTPEKNVFICSMCGRTFPTERSLYSHISWHSR